MVKIGEVGQEKKWLRNNPSVTFLAVTFLAAFLPFCLFFFFDFIERRVDQLKHPPRVFLEQELAYRFGKQIRDHEITNESLRQRVQALRDHRVIGDAVGTQLDRWREAFNPGHHVFPGNDLEDQRNTARSFMQFVFHDLVPA